MNELHLLIVREWGKDLNFNLEIENCLKEFYGNENVEVAVIPNNENVVNFFSDLVSVRRPVRIYLDTRIFIVNSALPHLIRHLTEVSMVNRILKSAKVIPVCMITDPLASHGMVLVGELLIHGIGILVPIGAGTTIHGFSRNSRTDPTSHPISYGTGIFLKKSALVKSKDLYLGGSMYEPRKSFINNIICELHGSDISIEVLPKKSNSYIDYILKLSEFRIVINTNFVVNSHKVHMVGRNLETLTAGSLLMTQNTPLLEKLFTEGEHYINIESPSDAATKVKYYLEHQEEARGIALAGQEKALCYARENHFVSLIDGKIEELQLGVRE